jgi:hypothetical protein
MPRKRPAASSASLALDVLDLRGVYKKKGKFQVLGPKKEYLGLVSTREEAARGQVSRQSARAPIPRESCRTHTACQHQRPHHGSLRR